MTTQLLSVYAKDSELYILESQGGEIKVIQKKYDSPISVAHNMPSSAGVLPTDPNELKYYLFKSDRGIYEFEKTNVDWGDWATYIHDSQLQKDIFILMGRYIVHVQDFEPQSTEDEIIGKVLDAGIRGNTPLEFLDNIEKKLQEEGVEFDKIVDDLDSLDFETTAAAN